MHHRTLPLALLGALASTTLLAAEEKENASEWNVEAPPGQSREIDINTTRGTWMSLDVSPDGDTIVFDLLGDIYRLPIDGGKAEPIDSGLSWSMQPRFSPDGSSIAYTSDAGGGDNIWIMRADGSDKRQLTHEDFRLLNNPTWSPDGNYIAARKHYTTTRSLGTGEIWLYHVKGGVKGGAKGGDGIAVVEKPGEKHQKELGEPAFSPDGRYIYFSVDSTSGPIFQYAQDSNAQIFEIRRHDLETGKTVGFVTGAGGAVRPEPSPDGRWLAFVRRFEGESALFLKDLTSGAERPIVTGLDQDLQEVWGVQGLYPNMDWTPESESIVFWSGGQIRRVDIASGDVIAIPFRVEDTREVYAVSRPEVEVAPQSFDARMVRNAAVSPDGSRVVFEVTGRLYTKTLPDGEPRRLTSDAGERFEYFPSWSPDGRRIAFVSWSDQALGHIASVAAGGGRSARLTERPGHFLAPRYSPDGRNIVFEATDGGFLTAPEWSITTGVFIVPAGGGEARLVTDDGSNPHFSAGADRLYVTRGTDDATQLVSIDLNGEAPRTHAKGEYLTRFEVAPDGRHLAYRENFHVYVLPLPPGGQALSLGTEVGSLPMTRASGDGGHWPHWTGGGSTLHWSLGPTLYTSTVDELFARSGDDGEGGYEPPVDGAPMTVRLEADRPRGQVALTGARIVTMSGGDGGVIEDGVLLTEGHRIAAIGARGEVDIPSNAEVVDVSGRTIIPGLIDAHAHGSQGVGIIPEQNWIAYATLALGVTTVHDPSNDAEEVFAAAEMQRTGKILAPRIFSTGDVVYGARSTSFAKIDSPDDAREHIRRLKAQGAISVKNYNQPRRDQRQQVVAAARQEEMLVVTEGASLFHMDLSMVADGNSTIEHNLPQSMLYDDVLQFWRQTRVAYTPTLVVTYGGLAAETWWYQETDVWKHPILSNFVPPQVLRPRSIRRLKAPMSEYHHAQSAATAKLLADQGVLVSIGAHGQREGLASHWEMWSFVQGGMSPLEALRAATAAPAEALGFHRDLGSLEAGKLADLVVIDGDILADIRVSDRVSMVMLNGRLFDARTLNETVTGDRRTEPFYWQTE